MLHFASTLDFVLFLIQSIGCISFSISGAAKALRKNADFLGVLVLSLIEIFGGGLFRDLIISQGPPHIFWHDEYLFQAAVSIVVIITCFILASIPKTAIVIDKISENLLSYTLDAIGISIFCIGGVRIANASLPESVSAVGAYVYIILLGVITGVGGGMFRDVFVGEIPMVFRKHFYMTPCIIGTTAFAFLYRLGVNELVSVLIGVVIIVSLRVCACIFHWNLPQARAYEALQKNKNQQ